MKKIYISIAIVSAIILSSCNKDSGTPPTPPKPTPPVSEVKLQNPINDFVWKAMNSWYNWQKNVPNLADSKDDNQNDYYTYLNRFSKPENLFKSLLYQYKTVDRFSWFIEDYEEQEKQFQGIDKSFGMEFGLTRITGTSNDLIMYIQYVSPNSPASKAEIKRGDIINAINGSVLNMSNYENLLKNYYNMNSIEFNFVENDGVTSKGKKTVTKAEVTDNPVAFTKIFDNIGGKKVGYLVYNGFRSSYNDELNAAFGKFKSTGIQELILDLRINGGGSVETSAYLASMIYNGTGKFAELTFNHKNTNQNNPYNFTNKLNVYELNGKKIKKIGEQPINRLSGLTKLYVLTSRGTASASEAIINGLRPFMEVKTIGTTTRGKNVGSITLYDSPKSGYVHPKYLYDNNPNKQAIIKEFENNNHKNAMQPLVFFITNTNGKGDYSQGFTPTILVEEHKIWSEILPFGNENEVMLKTALNDIKGVAARPINYINNTAELITKGIKEKRFKNEMYIEDASIFLKQKNK